ADLVAGAAGEAALADASRAQHGDEAALGSLEHGAQLGHLELAADEAVVRFGMRRARQGDPGRVVEQGAQRPRRLDLELLGKSQRVLAEVGAGLRVPSELALGLQ